MLIFNAFTHYITLIILLEEFQEMISEKKEREEKSLGDWVSEISDLEESNILEKSAAEIDLDDVGMLANWFDPETVNGWLLDNEKDEFQ